MQKKSNEIPAIPKLLEQLEIAGHIISVDAMGTQTAIAGKIRKKEADYLTSSTAKYQKNFKSACIHPKIKNSFLSF